MARRAARRDANEREIIDALREVGATVQPLDIKGVPDLLVGFAGRNLLMEVKDGSKPPSARRLTSDQVKWHREWGGLVHVVNNVNEAMIVMLSPTQYESWTEV